MQSLFVISCMKRSVFTENVDKKKFPLICSLDLIAVFFSRTIPTDRTGRKKNKNADIPSTATFSDRVFAIRLLKKKV